MKEQIFTQFFVMPHPLIVCSLSHGVLKIQGLSTVITPYLQSLVPACTLIPKHAAVQAPHTKQHRIHLPTDFDLFSVTESTTYLLKVDVI